MGYLLKGRWHPGRRDNHDGAFVRQSSTFRDSISAGGRYPPAARRYRLYVSLACPWASRAIIVRKLKKLEAAVSMTVVHPDMLENGWTFGGEVDATTGRHFLYEVYRDAAPGFSGHATVPVLWDTETRTIVNNESSDIIRMLNREFDEWGDPSVDLYPDDLAAEIDAVNGEIYGAVNNGVYRAGFATKETAYHDAVWKLFDALERIESRLADGRFLVGAALHGSGCGGYLLPLSVSTSSTIRISSATSGICGTTRTFGAGSRTSTNCPASARRSISCTSSGTTTEVRRG